MQWTGRGTVENNDTDILLRMGNNSSALDFFDLYFTQEVVD